MKKIKLIRQHDSMLCGVACLQMICNFYGKQYSSETLARLAGITNQGLSMLGIKKTAEYLGLEAVCAKISMEQLCTMPLPCILHWNQNHFVVLYHINKNQIFYIADPGKGMLKFRKDEFKEYWSAENCTTPEGNGIALLLDVTDNFGKVDEDKSVNKNIILHFLCHYLQGYKKYFILILCGLLIGSVLQLLFPFLTQNIVDLGIKNKDINFIWLILLGSLLIVISQAIAEITRRWLLLHISIRINICMISDFLMKLLKLPMRFFDSKKLGDFMQRMNDYSRVQNFLTGQVVSILFSVVNLVVFCSVLWWYNSLIFGVYMAGSLLYTLWALYFLKSRRTIDYELFELQAISQNKTYQFFSSMQEIKLQDCENRRRWEWEDVQADFFKVQMKSLKLSQTQSIGGLLINEIKNIFITVLSATIVINGNITLGSMLAIQFIVGQLNIPVSQIIDFIYSLQDVKLSLERMNDVYQLQDENNKNGIRDFKIEKGIDIENIFFKYNIYAPKYTLEDISLSIPKGKITAIVGASGSGKTTLMKLILGYYHVEKGIIRIADQDLTKYDYKWWRKQCGVVMQDGVIFSESIARNIAVDDNEIDFDKLVYASKIAHIYDYIVSLPLKFDTIVGKEGHGLSQGQKQRILIARAIYKVPEYLFFDEATNALDAQNERIIVERLQEFYQGRTVVVIAHRLSTVKNADQIIVLDDGKIVEHGKHEELINLKGYYYQLVKNQLELGN